MMASLVNTPKPGEIGDEWNYAWLDTESRLVPEAWDGATTSVGGVAFDLSWLDNGKWRQQLAGGDPNAMTASFFNSLGTSPLDVVVTHSRVVMICAKPARLEKGLVGAAVLATRKNALVAQVRYEWLWGVGWKPGRKEQLRLWVKGKDSSGEAAGALDIWLGKGASGQQMAGQIAKLAAEYCLAGTSEKPADVVARWEAVRDGGPIPAPGKKGSFAVRDMPECFFVGEGGSMRPPLMGRVG